MQLKEFLTIKVRKNFQSTDRYLSYLFGSRNYCAVKVKNPLYLDLERKRFTWNLTRTVNSVIKMRQENTNSKADNLYLL